MTSLVFWSLGCWRLLYTYVSPGLSYYGSSITLGYDGFSNVSSAGVYLVSHQCLFHISACGLLFVLRLASAVSVVGSQLAVGQIAELEVGSCVN